ncbi:DNA-binding response regulator [Saccharophagus sp. K07]|jgi:two-component system response regulator BaeR|uniref:response regulator transcription factor n=1 Tax=Saccharophagus sp. K07 TaxID=2283636 RepID=UPI001651FF57|nr:response regulator transcription factor [Saccharophagus sp. K07]MBC6904069.1 DNA-binding response regulator [Saccharophagus sp. K07]
MSKTILVVEDDERIASLICKYLQMESYAYHVARTGLDAITLFEKTKPNLVILDLMLPSIDGAAVCQKIRAISDVPVIMVSALSEESHRLEGFSIGADDYICKPFNPRELMARIKAVLRRASPSEPRLLSYGTIHMDLDERTVKVSGQPITLTQVEFRLLEVLLSNPSRVYSREELLEGCHIEYSESSVRSIDFHIKNLRRKLHPLTEDKLIKTVYGFGYKLI